METILQQLGGNRFVAMTGASHFVGNSRRLQFRIGGGAVNKATNVRITLDGSDTYTVEFFNIRGADVKKVSQHQDIYAEDLCRLFAEETGMRTSL